MACPLPALSGCESATNEPSQLDARRGRRSDRIDDVARRSRSDDARAVERGLERRRAGEAERGAERNEVRVLGRIGEREPARRAGVARRERRQRKEIRERVSDAAVNRTIQLKYPMKKKRLPC